MNDFRKIRRNEAHRAAHYRTGIEDKRVLVTLPVVAVGMAVADKIPFAKLFLLVYGLSCSGSLLSFMLPKEAQQQEGQEEESACSCNQKVWQHLIVIAGLYHCGPLCTI